MAGDLPPGLLESDLEAGQDSVLLQDESRIRIVLFRSTENSRPRVSKIYRTPVALTWRDLFRYPQAQREFENLQFAFGKGLPVAEPLGFGLSRQPGRDWYSQLTTAYLHGRTLRDLLASRDGGDLPYALCTGKDMTGSRFALYDIWNMVVDFRTQCRLEKNLVLLFLEAYASAAGADPATLQAQVDRRRGRKSVFAERLYIRTVRAFRLKPY